MLITKRSGNLTIYDDSKVVRSILKANERVPAESISPNLAAAIADEVFTKLTEETEIITTQDIRSGVYQNLCERGLFLTAKEYMEYKKS